MALGVPVPAWAMVPEFDAGAPAREGWHLTFLLWMRHVHAGLGQSFHASAIRLETSLAVQNQSQWRLDFDARFQRVDVHWVRVVRRGVRVDKLGRDRLRLLQRETELDHHVISGNWTLLAVLDDVRVGDILEVAFTYESRHPIRPGACEQVYLVPPQAVVPRYLFAVDFPERLRSLRSRAAAGAPERREQALADGYRRWVWEGRQAEPREPEGGQPVWYLDCLWMEVSDLGSWKELAALVRQAWLATRATEGQALAAEFGVPALIVGAREVNELIEKIQDHYRYLSVSLDSGGWIPSPPDEVAERRHGDCKDLVWLAATVLESWGVRARPVLVASGLRSSIRAHLPSSVLFNHAILEVTVDGVTRWFDLTLRAQGGTYATRFVPPYGVGLRIDEGTEDLVEQPELPGGDVYAMKETLYVDTIPGRPYHVEIRVCATGRHADSMRMNRFARGAEDHADERLKIAQARMANAKRVQPLQWRDDRVANVVEIVEALEVPAALTSDEAGKRAVFDVPPNLMMTDLAMPEDRPRRTPWSLPHPLDLRYAMTIRGHCLGKGGPGRRRWEDAFVVVTADDTREAKAWTRTLWYRSKKDVVPADQVQAHRAVIAELQLATSWRLYLSWKDPAPARPSSFGRLPDTCGGPDALVAPADPNEFPLADKMDERAGAVTPGGTRGSGLLESRSRRIGQIAIIAAFCGIVIASRCSPA